MRFPSPGQIFGHMRSHPILSVIAVLGVAAILKGVYNLTAELSIQMAAQLEPDAKIYVAGGRALLNGVHLYAELFENKPPLIFLLTAFSLVVTGTQTVAAAVQVFALAVLAAVFPIFFFHASRGLPSRHRFFRTMTGLLLGLCIARYTAVNAGYIQTESLGGIAGVIYLLLLAIPECMSGVRRMMALGALLFIAGAMKEPIVLVTVVTSFLFIRDLQQFKVDVAIPCAIAGVIGALLLITFGALGDYLRIYLPHMLLTHVEMRGSPLARAFGIDRLVIDLWNFSPLLCLGLIIIAAVLLWNAIAGRQRPLWMIVVYAVSVALITSFVVGLGGQYYPHHFIFALPFYAGLCFAWTIGDQDDVTQSWSSPALLLVVIFLSLGLLMQPLRRGIWTEPFWHGEMEAKHRDAAAQFDRMMDACAYDRYLAFGADTEDLWAYSLHTPYSAAFTTYRLDLTQTEQQFADMATEQFGQAPLIILHPSFRDRLSKMMGAELDAAFSPNAPACAASFMPLKDGLGNPYIVLFHR